MAEAGEKGSRLHQPGPQHWKGRGAGESTDRLLSGQEQSGKAARSTEASILVPKSPPCALRAGKWLKMAPSERQVPWGR